MTAIDATTATAESTGRAVAACCARAVAMVPASLA